MLDSVLLVNKFIYVNELYLCVDMVLCWMVLVLEDFICMQNDDLMLFELIWNHIYANWFKLHAKPVNLSSVYTQERSQNGLCSVCVHKARDHVATIHAHGSCLLKQIATLPRHPDLDTRQIGHTANDEDTWKKVGPIRVNGGTKVTHNKGLAQQTSGPCKPGTKKCTRGQGTVVCRGVEMANRNAL
jgi:hypothetical protein